MSRGALFTTPLEFDLGASWCAGVIALLKSQSLYMIGSTVALGSIMCKGINNCFVSKHETRGNVYYIHARMVTLL